MYSQLSNSVWSLSSQPIGSTILGVFSFDRDCGLSLVARLSRDVASSSSPLRVYI